MHDHSKHSHDHSGHTHDHSGHTHDHSGHTHDHPSHTNEKEMEIMPDHGPIIHETQPLTPAENPIVVLNNPEAPTDNNKNILTHVSLDKNPGNAILNPVIPEDFPEDQVATASAGHLPAVEESQPIQPVETGADKEPTSNPFGDLFPKVSSEKPKETSQDSNAPLFEVLGTNRPSINEEKAHQEVPKETVSNAGVPLFAPFTSTEAPSPSSNTPQTSSFPTVITEKSTSAPEPQTPTETGIFTYFM